MPRTPREAVSFREGFVRPTSDRLSNNELRTTMFKLSFNTRKNGFKSRLAPWLLAAILTVAAPGSASATGGSWGGSGGFGLSGGSWGGSGGGLFGGRQPIRNLLGRIASRMGGGSLGSGGSGGGSLGNFGGRFSGGSFGGNTGGSFGGSTGGWSGGSAGSTLDFAGGFSGSNYGSWGSGYSSYLNDSPSYVSTELAAPAYSTQFATQSFVDTSAFVTPAVTGCLSCDSTGLAGIPMGQGYVETGYQSDTGFHDGSLPSYDGVPVDDGQIIDDEGLYDPGIIGPNDYYDGSDSLLDDGPLPPPGPAGDDSAFWRQKNKKPSVKPAVLSVALPAEAEVYINGRLTKTEGSIRNYVARKLKAGEDIGYQIKAVINRDGKRLVRTQTVRMKAGITRTVEFDFNQPVTTVLALKVPADAKVRLCGAETTATGERRFFETSKLKDGQSWEDYEIEVIVNRDGKEVVARKSLELCAGDSESIVFDFEDSTGKLVALK